MPTFNDLYYTDMGNAFLKPEYAEQFNVGLKYARDFERSPFMRMLDVSVDAYYNKITDKIIAYPGGAQFRWTMLNLGEVEIKGVDAVLNALFTLGKLEVTTKFQYTYQEAIDITDPADTYYRDQTLHPWHSGSAILALFYKGWGLTGSFIYTGQRYNQQENIPRNHTQPWHTSDLSLQKTSSNPHPDTQGHGRDQQPLRTGLRRGAQLPDAEDQPGSSSASISNPYEP